MVLAAEGRKANDLHADCYKYVCVPEYGTANGRLHFHAVHFMRTLPTGSVDPNFGRRVRNLFFFQAEDGIRDYKVTGVQTCALPISNTPVLRLPFPIVPTGGVELLPASWPPIPGGNYKRGTKTPTLSRRRRPPLRKLPRLNPSQYTSSVHKAF